MPCLAVLVGGLTLLGCNDGPGECETDNDCDEGFVCNEDEGVCEEERPETPLGNGSACDADVQCASNHCQNGFCCDGTGDCCASPTDCPASYTVASVCLDSTTATTCQGEATVAVCTDNVCDSMNEQPDDSGCDGLEHDCGAYKPIVCTDGIDQDSPLCPTSCTDSNDCVTGTPCVLNVCQAMDTVGEPCEGTGQGSCEVGLKCENGVCCSASGGTCCDEDNDCAGGLACNDNDFSGLFECFSSCNEHDDTRCANAGTQVCQADNTCADKLIPNAVCVTDADCSSDICECFDEDCTNTKCRAEACPVCEFAVSLDDCGGDLGNPGPISVEGCDDTRGCFGGVCLLNNGETCAINADCGEVCIDFVCAPRGGVGDDCDETQNEDCALGLSCVTGTCLANDGSACETDGDCVNGICAGDVCCATACVGPCASCATGTCVMPADDAACGDIQCDGLDTTCRDYHNLTSNRCEAIGDCKDDNTVEDCTAFTDASSSTDCGECQLCTGFGACDTSFCRSGDTCVSDNCRFVVTVHPGQDCASSCTLYGGASCIDMGTDDAATNNHFRMPTGIADPPCVPDLSGGTCDTANASTFCLWNCLCEYGP